MCERAYFWISEYHGIESIFGVVIWPITEATVPAVRQVIVLAKASSVLGSAVVPALDGFLAFHATVEQHSTMIVLTPIATFKRSSMLTLR